MTVREYIGARYVPLFADPIEWDNTRTYEALTVVTYLGNSYTSRQAVPIGISISNDDYWALTANYNAQIEAYRAEVQVFDERITNNAGDITNNADDISTINNILPIADFSTQNTVKNAIDALQSSIMSLQNTVNANQTANNNRFVTLTTNDFTFPQAINSGNTQIYAIWDRVEKVLTLTGLIMFSAITQENDKPVLTLPNLIDTIAVRQIFYSSAIKSANASPWILDNIQATDIKFEGKNMILPGWSISGQPTIGLIFQGAVFPLRNGIATA